MCGYLSRAFERTKHMSGNMVTGKPSTWVKPVADFIPHVTWDWVSHACYGGYKCGHCTAAAGVSGALYAKVVSSRREQGIDEDGWHVWGRSTPTCRVFRFTLQGLKLDSNRLLLAANETAWPLVLHWVRSEMRFTPDNLLFVLNACYHVCLEGANLVKIMMLEFEKLKLDCRYS
jgi:hypothetical protein